MRALLTLGALALLAGCPARPAPGPAPATAPSPGAPPPPLGALTLDGFVGDWRWLHGSTEDGVYRLERERWRFDPVGADPDGRAVLTGRYRRDVAVVSVDGTPFACNQQPAYVQTALYDLRATVEVGGDVVIEETGYQTVPSPCEPGARQLATYRATRDGRTVTLAWDGGAQRLHRAGAPIDDAALAAPAPPAAPGDAFAGAWHWSMRSRDDAHDVRDEDEAWDLAVGDDGVVGGTYVRTVTVHAGDGRPLACAGAPSYRYVDRYTVRGRLADGVLALEEAAVDAGDHPCLAGTSGRRLDTATAVAVGDHLVITWRGGRQQVLHRAVEHSR